MHCPNATDKMLIFVFDKYQHVSAKDSVIVWRAGKVTIDYELSIIRPLPRRDAIMKRKSNKQRLDHSIASVLNSFSFGSSTTMASGNDSAFSHDEAGISQWCPMSFRLPVVEKGYLCSERRRRRLCFAGQLGF